MDILKICACAIVTVVLAATLKKDMPAAAMLMCAVFGVLLIINALPCFKSAAEIFDILDGTGTSDYFGIILKILGAAWAAQLTAQLCADMGYGYVGSKVELAGKIIILSYSLPLIKNLLGIIQTML